MARFVITDPAAQTQIFEISSPTISVGRADSNDLVLRHPSVSRHHVRISVLPGDITLLNDLGSMNGTFVNNQQVQEHQLKDQDRIAVGMYELKYETTRAGDLHIQAGNKAVTDVDGLVGADDISTRPATHPTHHAPGSHTDRGAGQGPGERKQPPETAPGGRQDALVGIDA